MPPIRKYAIKTYGPKWLTYCLPLPLVENLTPPSPPPEVLPPPLVDNLTPPPSSSNDPSKCSPPEVLPPPPLQVENLTPPPSSSNPSKCSPPEALPPPPVDNLTPPPPSNPSNLCIPPEVFPTEGVICELNCSPWDVVSPHDHQEFSNFKEFLERKGKIGGDDTMAMTETRTLAEPDFSYKDDDKPKKKITKRRTMRIIVTSENTVNKVVAAEPVFRSKDDNIEKKKKIRKRRTMSKRNGASENSTVNKVAVTKKIKKRRTTKRNGTSENTVNKVADREKTTIKKRRSTKKNGASKNTVHKVVVAEANYSNKVDDREKTKIKKRRTTEIYGDSENAANKGVDNSPVKSDGKGGWCNRQIIPQQFMTRNNLHQSQNVESERKDKIQTESYSAKPRERMIIEKEKPKKMEPIDFIVHRVCKNDFYYYEDDDDEEEEKKRKVVRKNRKKRVL